MIYNQKIVGSYGVGKSLRKVSFCIMVNLRFEIQELFPQRNQSFDALPVKIIGKNRENRKDELKTPSNQISVSLYWKSSLLFLLS